MELNKLDLTKYNEDSEKMDNRFILMEAFNKENHIHYIQN